MGKDGCGSLPVTGGWVGAGVCAGWVGAVVGATVGAGCVGPLVGATVGAVVGAGWPDAPWQFTVPLSTTDPSLHQ
jgi:hypothetical protein